MTRYAMFVHDTEKEPYAAQIAAALKLIETRTRNTLKRLIGEDVLIIRTGKATEVIGSVKIDKCVFHTAEELDSMRCMTLIPKDSKYNCPAGKFCYYLSNARAFSAPISLNSFNVVSRNRSYCTLIDLLS